MWENVLIFRRYIPKYLGVKCHDAYNLFSDGWVKTPISLCIDREIKAMCQMLVSPGESGK